LPVAIIGFPIPEPNKVLRNDNDPQPDVDGEMLERMYRELNPDA